MANDKIPQAPMGFEVAPLGPPQAQNPTSPVDQAVEWMQANPEAAQRLNEYFEQHPDEFDKILEALDK